MVGALKILQELVEHSQISLSEHEGDDGLREEVGHGAVEHTTERADAVVELKSVWVERTTTHHALQVTLAGAHKVSLQS